MLGDHDWFDPVESGTVNHFKLMIEPITYYALFGQKKDGSWQIMCTGSLGFLKEEQQIYTNYAKKATEHSWKGQFKIMLVKETYHEL